MSGRNLLLSLGERLVQGYLWLCGPSEQAAWQNAGTMLENKQDTRVLFPNGVASRLYTEKSSGRWARAWRWIWKQTERLDIHHYLRDLATTFTLFKTKHVIRRSFAHLAEYNTQFNHYLQEVLKGNSVSRPSSATSLHHWAAQAKDFLSKYLQYLPQVNASPMQPQKEKKGFSVTNNLLRLLDHALVGSRFVKSFEEHSVEMTQALQHAELLRFEELSGHRWPLAEIRKACLGKETLTRHDLNNLEEFFRPLLRPTDNNNSPEKPKISPTELHRVLKALVALLPSSSEQTTKETQNALYMGRLLLAIDSLDHLHDFMTQPDEEHQKWVTTLTNGSTLPYTINAASRELRLAEELGQKKGEDNAHRVWQCHDTEGGKDWVIRTHTSSRLLGLMEIARHHDWQSNQQQKNLPPVVPMMHADAEGRFSVFLRLSITPNQCAWPIEIGDLPDTKSIEGEENPVTLGLKAWLQELNPQLNKALSSLVSVLSSMVQRRSIPSEFHPDLFRLDEEQGDLYLLRGIVEVPFDWWAVETFIEKCSGKNHFLYSYLMMHSGMSLQPNSDQYTAEANTIFHLLTAHLEGSPSSDDTKAIANIQPDSARKKVQLLLQKAIETRDELFRKLGGVYDLDGHNHTKIKERIGEEIMRVQHNLRSPTRLLTPWFRRPIMLQVIKDGTSKKKPLQLRRNLKINDLTFRNNDLYFLLPPEHYQALPPPSPRKKPTGLLMSPAPSNGDHKANGENRLPPPPSSPMPTNVSADKPFPTPTSGTPSKPPIVMVFTPSPSTESTSGTSSSSAASPSTPSSSAKVSVIE